MTVAPPRTRPERLRDTRKLLETEVDVWVATASAGAPYLVPLSLAWLDDRVVVAIPPDSRTARNLEATGTARLGVGPTRDVVMIDAVLERSEPPESELAERYAQRADWDPRRVEEIRYQYYVLRPERVQAWRESNEIAGRTLMRHGDWLPVDD